MLAADFLSSRSIFVFLPNLKVVANCERVLSSHNRFEIDEQLQIFSSSCSLSSHSKIANYEQGFVFTNNAVFVKLQEF